MAAQFIDIAKQSKVICDKYNIPLLINDRIDVALAIGAAGVHLGQTDMPVEQARRLLPPNAIIGVSCNTVAHVQDAVRARVDYIGIGAVWGTQTKKLTSPIIGVRGVGAMLEALAGTHIRAVAIGGIKSTNLLRTLHGTTSVSNRALDGVAIVSDIVASTEPKQAAEKLRLIISQFQTYYPAHPNGLLPQSLIRETILYSVGQLITELRKRSPLIHQVRDSSYHHSVKRLIYRANVPRSRTQSSPTNLPMLLLLWVAAQSWQPSLARWRI